MRRLTTLLLVGLLLAAVCRDSVHAQPPGGALRFGEDREGTVGVPDSLPRLMRVLDDKHLLLSLRSPDRTVAKTFIVVWRGPTKGYYHRQPISWADLVGQGGLVQVAGRIKLSSATGATRTHVLYERYAKPGGKAGTGR